MKTIMTLGIALFLSCFLSCSSDDSAVIVDEEPQSEAVDTLIMGEASAGGLKYQLDKGIIYYYPPGMDPTTVYVIELSSRDYKVETGDGDILVFELSPAIYSELEPGTYTLGLAGNRILDGGHLHTNAWDYTLKKGKLIIDKIDDRYLLNWEFMAYREGYRIVETRNVYIKGSYEGELPQVEIHWW